MSFPRCFAAILLFNTVCAMQLAWSQSYPSKPIRFVTAEVGGGLDFTARLIAQSAAGFLGQPIIVDNRGGTSGMVAAQTVTRASPDGYTLLLYGSLIWLMPFMRDNVPYHPVKDFSPIILAVNVPNILVVNAALPAKSVKDLIALAKARPGELHYASGSNGASPHLAAELLNAMAGITITRVPYKGGGPAVNALMGGEVQLMFPVASTAMPHVKTGKVRALAVTTAQPSALFPEMPTVAASGGLPGYEAGATIGVFAPAKTPLAVINQLNREIARALDKADVKEKFSNGGVEVLGSTPEAFAAYIRSDMDRMGKVIKNAGIRAE